MTHIRLIKTAFPHSVSTENLQCS